MRREPSRRESSPPSINVPGDFDAAAAEDKASPSCVAAPSPYAGPSPRRRSVLARIFFGPEPTRALYLPTAGVKAFLRDHPRTPLVFLDVDGVLHPAYADDVSKLFRPRCVGALVAAVKRSGARVVLSSAWREQRGRAVMVDEVLTAAGLEPLLAATPSLLVGGRAGEIKCWLRKHAPPSGPPRWAAVDDHFLGRSVEAFQVHVDGTRGFGPADGDRLVALLADEVPEVDTPPRSASIAFLPAAAEPDGAAASPRRTSE